MVEHSVCRIMAPMYVVISFDFGGSNDVVLHALTSDIDGAERVYHVLASKPAFTSPDVHDVNCPFHSLVELVELPDTFLSVSGIGLFWGREHPDAKVLFSNNR